MLVVPSNGICHVVFDRSERRFAKEQGDEVENVQEEVEDQARTRERERYVFEFFQKNFFESSLVSSTQNLRDAFEL